jgi:hypothetical protein
MSSLAEAAPRAAATAAAAPRAAAARHPRRARSSAPPPRRAPATLAPSRRCGPPPPGVTLKIQDFGDAPTDFELADEVRGILYALLKDPTFGATVAQQGGLEEGASTEFTGMLFVPVPWSPSTRKGMPAEFERFQESPDYVVINVPPTFMFKAKCFKPTRLAAIFKRAGAADVEAAGAEAAGEAAT